MGAMHLRSMRAIGTRPISVVRQLLAEFDLARHACGGNDRRGHQQCRGCGRRRFQCARRAGARAGALRRIDQRHCRRHRVGIGGIRSAEFRANQNPARDAEPVDLVQAGGCVHPAYQNAINSARSRNAVVVIIAGNESTTANHQPGNCSGVITVAGTDYNGARVSTSNYGSIVEIAAPGAAVYSTLNTGTTTPGADTWAT